MPSQKRIYRKVLDLLVHNSFLRVLLPLVSWASIQLSLYMTFVYAPNEKVMGAVQRIFYFHVGSAFAAYLMLALVLIGSVVYLQTKEVLWHGIAESAVMVGFIFISANLATGMIWGHSAWNTWWRWEPRLVSSLALWLLLLSYILFTRFSEDSLTQRSSASVLGILSALQVPLVIFSVRLLSHSEQLHPQVAANQGLLDPRFTHSLICTSLALLVTSFWFWKIRLTQFLLAEVVQDLGLLSQSSTSKS